MRARSADTRDGDNNTPSRRKLGWALPGEQEAHDEELLAQEQDEEDEAEEAAESNTGDARSNLDAAALDAAWARASAAQQAVHAAVQESLSSAREHHSPEYATNNYSPTRADNEAGTAPAFYEPPPHAISRPNSSEGHSSHGSRPASSTQMQRGQQPQQQSAEQGGGAGAIFRNLDTGATYRADELDKQVLSALTPPWWWWRRRQCGDGGACLPPTRASTSGVSREEDALITAA